MHTPILSIITVCYNAGHVLPKTLESVLPQSFTCFEYLIIDGGSTDDTLSLLKQASGQFARRQISFRYISEPDQGIYDAMNKGTRAAKGTWLLFLNAGDLLAGPRILEQIFSEPSSGSVIYGDTLCVYQNKEKLYPALPLKNIIREMAFCHQSALIRRSLLLEQPYDTSYKICADHHFFLSMYLKEKAFDYRPVPVSVYEIDGYSDRNKLTAHREQHRMQKELHVFHPTMSWFLRECIFYAKQLLKSVGGQKIIDFVRQKRLQ
ncbi:MAG: glycosyltransferase [Lachnospiraceae bacterium]|jgi:glycosyltransferase involved in cell wall biosynthesis|nr:glycosyltransferase [Lachnospiraceae bacterium]